MKKLVSAETAITLVALPFSKEWCGHKLKERPRNVCPIWPFVSSGLPNGYIAS